MDAPYHLLKQLREPIVTRASLPNWPIIHDFDLGHRDNEFLLGMDRDAAGFVVSYADTYWQLFETNAGAVKKINAQVA